MKIITVPHETLRQEAVAVESVDKKLQQLVSELGNTLRAKKDPPGVGLAAPQVNVRRRLFATYLPLGEDGPSQLRVFINPTPIDHSEKMVFGPKKNEQRLEGCLSIPKIYGPVPRWQWVTYQYQELEGTQLVAKQEQFSDFAARVMQHETDHLNGILFTDYSLQFDLPVYQENAKGELEELDKSIIQAI